MLPRRAVIALKTGNQAQVIEGPGKPRLVTEFPFDREAALIECARRGIFPLRRDKVPQLIQ